MDQMSWSDLVSMVVNNIFNSLDSEEAIKATAARGLSKANRQLVHCWAIANKDLILNAHGKLLLGETEKHVIDRFVNSVDNLVEVRCWQSLREQKSNVE